MQRREGHDAEHAHPSACTREHEAARWKVDECRRILRKVPGSAGYRVRMLLSKRERREQVHAEQPLQETELKKLADGMSEDQARRSRRAAVLEPASTRVEDRDDLRASGVNRGGTGGKEMKMYVLNGGRAYPVEEATPDVNPVSEERQESAADRKAREDELEKEAEAAGERMAAEADRKEWDHVKVDLEVYTGTPGSRSLPILGGPRSTATR